MKLNPFQYEVLIQVLEYFEDREDADHDGEQFVPNPEMRLASDLRSAFYEVYRDAALSKECP